MLTHYKQLGFSLVELMIVIVIIGILAGIGIPSYQSYLQKAKFTQVITNTQPYKLAVSLALQQGEHITELNNGQHGIPSDTHNNESIDSIIVQSGIITATASTKAGGYTYILTPDSVGSEWTVSGTCINAGVC